MEEPSDRLREKEKPGRKYGWGQTSYAFGIGWTALGSNVCIFLVFTNYINKITGFYVQYNFH